MAVPVALIALANLGGIGAGTARAADTGDVFVHADRDGVPVFVDGVATGEVTPVLLHGLPPGTRHITLVDGCQGASADVEVAASRIARAELSVGVLHGRVQLVPSVDVPLTVSSPALAAQVPGGQPFTLPCGATLLHVAAEGFHVADVRVVVPAGGTLEVAVPLERLQSGTLVVAPTPLTAAVTVDHVRVADGPTTVEHILSGPHEVEVAALGYAPWRETVTVAPDAVLRLDVVLDSEARRREEARGQREPVPAGRWVLNGVATGAALGLGAVAGWQYAASSAAYEQYLNVPDNDRADQIWAEQVQPEQTRAIGAGVGAGALLVGSAVLWGTTFKW